MRDESQRPTYYSNLATPFEKEQRRKTLAFVIVALFTASLALTIYNLQFGSVLSLISLGSVDLVSLIALLVNARGRYVLAALMCTSMSLVAITFNVYDGYGLFDSGIVAYPLFIVLGAMLLGRRSVKWFTFAAIASLFGIGYLQATGHIHVNARADKIGGLLPISILFALAGLVIRASMRDMERSLDRVKSSDEELRRANETLEERIARREAELREAQSWIIEAEKLAAIGRLGATAAHELNTPLGAMASASTSALAALGNLRLSLRIHLESGTETESELFLRLLALPKSSELGADWRVRRTVVEQLESWGLPEAHSLADWLLDCGLGINREIAETVAGARTTPQGRAVTDALFELSGLESLLLVQQEAARKGRRALEMLTMESWSAANKEEAVDLGVSLGSALESLASRLGPGVTLDCQPAENLVVHSDPERLNLVWTILLRNSLDAIGLEGRITLRAQAEGALAKVEIEDTGPGIPAEFQASIFRPFFTTKRMGEGLGLGLHTARHIIEGYGGTIGFESRPGCTIFRLLLPLATET